MEKIGLIGTGVMGLTAAKKLLESGYPVIAYDAYSKALKKAERIGTEVVDAAAEVAKATDIVLMFLPGPAEVELCVSGSSGLLSASDPGMVLVDLSTIDPNTTQRMAKLAIQKEVGYLDAPVLGRPATIGNWALPVGGSIEVLESCRSVLEVFAANIIYIGDSGSGNKIKLLNQLMFGAINAMTAEMMAISQNVGISPKLLFETITGSQAGTVSNLFKELGKRISTDDYENPTFTVDLLIKDVKLAANMASANNAPPILCRTVELINEVARAQGMGLADTAAMWKIYKNIWN